MDWKSPRQLLEKPNAIPDLTSVMLKTEVYPGDRRMPCYDSFKELKALKGLVRGLFEEEVIWRDLNGEGQSSMEDDLLRVLQVARSKGPRDIFNLHLDEGLESFRSGVERTEIDFTDLLWLTLSEAQSYDDLCTVFRKTVRVICEEELRPFVCILWRTHLKIVSLSDYGKKFELSSV